MQKNIDQLYDKISDIQTKKEFITGIKNLQKQYDELLDEYTAGLIIVDKLGRNKDSITKIKDIEPGMECTIEGRITNIGETHVFNKKNGLEGRVINLDISDDTDTCKLVLWHKDVELVKNKKITIGSNVKIINGYVKQNQNSKEINVGRWSLIELKKNNNRENEIEKNDNIIEGEILEILPSKAFFRGNGKFGFVTNIKLKTRNGIKKITLWDKKVKEIQKYKTGDKIQIENITFKQKNGVKELHLNGKSIIKKL